MKKIFFIASLLFLTNTTITSCSEDYDCGKHNGKTLYQGPKGGCYYINSSGNKTYVDRSECNC